MGLNGRGRGPRCGLGGRITQRACTPIRACNALQVTWFIKQPGKKVRLACQPSVMGQHAGLAYQVGMWG
jgi:hypothetical protein